MNKNRATSKGECQICGATQLLPNGRLSCHGYTTRWGFFSGVCTGSYELPFEVSKDAIARRVAGTESDIASLQQEVNYYEDVNSEVNGRDVAWAAVSYDRDLRPVWAQVKVVGDRTRTSGEPTAPGFTR